MYGLENPDGVVLSMSTVDEAELMQILERIGKLSKRPPNPGLAYRNLEMIEALIEGLTKKMTGGENGKRKPPRQPITEKKISPSTNTGKTDASYG